MTAVSETPVDDVRVRYAVLLEGERARVLGLVDAEGTPEGQLRVAGEITREAAEAERELEGRRTALMVSAMLYEPDVVGPRAYNLVGVSRKWAESARKKALGVRSLEGRAFERAVRARRGDLFVEGAAEGLERAGVAALLAEARREAAEGRRNEFIVALEARPGVRQVDVAALAGVSRSRVAQLVSAAKRAGE